jgi:ElaB/YqjD/DUF883 family membrane-anchored ribosome-binding protein
MANTVQSKQQDIGERASEMAKDLQEMGENARRMAAERAEMLRETANEYLDEGRVRLRELGDTVQHRVQEQPMQSILIATAVGFLLGMIFVRR